MFQKPVTIEEKVDGSQFSFGKDDDGDLFIRSRSKDQYPETDKMFQIAIDRVLAVANVLPPGYTYRGEYLSKPKHNVLAYDRVPKNNIVIFDIDRGNQHYLNARDKYHEAERLGFECVPLLHRGIVDDRAEMLKLLERDSFLGGTTIEGIVIKQYEMYDRQDKVLMAKYVSEKFKEVADAQWGRKRTTHQDIITQLVQRYTTQARWQKAVQHLRERGVLKDEPCDIGPLIKEVQMDTFDECRVEMEKILMQWARPQITKGITRGFPEWYKEQLAAKCFEEDKDA
jgi:ATP-dependent RNA circularization protein (DNA/RNA ligase family)